MEPVSGKIRGIAKMEASLKITDGRKNKHVFDRLVMFTFSLAAAMLID